MWGWKRVLESFCKTHLTLPQVMSGWFAKLRFCNLFCSVLGLFLDCLVSRSILKSNNSQSSPWENLVQNTILQGAFCPWLVAFGNWFNWTKPNLIYMFNLVYRNYVLSIYKLMGECCYVCVHIQYACSVLTGVQFLVFWLNDAYMLHDSNFGTCKRYFRNTFVSWEML